jgi:hypothetical protein
MKRFLILDGYNNKVHRGEVIGTIVPQNSRWGLTNGYKMIELVYEQDSGSRLHLEESAERSSL